MKSSLLQRSSEKLFSPACAYLWLGQDSEIILIPFQLSGGLTVEGGGWLPFLLEVLCRFLGCVGEGEAPAGSVPTLRPLQASGGYPSLAQNFKAALSRVFAVRAGVRAHVCVCVLGCECGRF